MGFPIEFYIYVGYGLFAMVVVFFGLNFFLGGLLRPFLEVKRSRGSKILIRARHPVQDYFRAGRIEEGFLIFIDREKNTRRIAMKPGIVSRAASIYWVEIDDEKNCFFKRETAEAVATYDPVKVDNLIVRALMRPGIFGDQMVKIIIILIVVALLFLLVIGYFTFKNTQMINLVLEAVQGVGVGVVA